MNLLESENSSKHTKSTSLFEPENSNNQIESMNLLESENINNQSEQFNRENQEEHEQLEIPEQNIQIDFKHPNQDDSLKSSVNQEDHEQLEIHESSYQDIQFDVLDKLFQDMPISNHEQLNQNIPIDLLESREEPKTYNPKSKIKIHFEPISVLDSLNKYSIYRKVPEVDRNLMNFLKIYQEKETDKKNRIKLFKSFDSNS